MIQTAPSARLYFRAAGLIDAPFGLDGRFERLAGGLQFFSAWDVVAVDGGVRTGHWLVPIDQIETALGSLTGEQAASARTMMSRATATRAPLQLGDRTIRLDQPQVMGIFNLTPDSFSGGNLNLNDPAAAASSAIAMAAHGAAMIDIGGESTRPGAKIIWEQDEIDRVLPVLQRMTASGVALSIDTRKAAVMEAALDAGAHMVNDVSALLYDDRAVTVMAAATCPVVLMHYPGKPDDPHSRAHYSDPLIETYDWLEDRIDAVVAGGVARGRIIVDPGIGFGKGVAENLTIINGLSLFHGLGCPILLGASRKRLIGALANEAPVEQRLAGSLTLALKAAEQGAQIIRVHDVAETVQALKIWRGMRDAALSPT